MSVTALPDRLSDPARAFATRRHELLIDGQQPGRSAAIDKDLAHTMARSFRRNHNYIDVGGRLNGCKMNIKTVSEEQSLPRSQVGSNRFPVNGRLSCVGRQKDDDISPDRGFSGRNHTQPLSLGTGARFTCLGECDHNFYTAVAKIQSVCMTL